MWYNAEHMKKNLVIGGFVIILAGGYFVYDYQRIKPLMVEDITEIMSNGSEIAIGVSFEDTILNVQQLGSFNWNRDEGWKDDNRYVDGKKRPLVITVSNQQGLVDAQILTFSDKGKIFKVYLPALSEPEEKGGPWAWLYIDSDGSSYWGCAEGQTCDGGVKGSKGALRKENLARKAI